MSIGASLLSTQNYVEVPFIILKIGDYTFGKFNKKVTSAGGFKIDFPNYVQSLSVDKVNGQINTYTIQILYAITQTDDPNMFEKVFSSISKSRTVSLIYGDCSSPEFIYKEEEALITKLSTRVNMQNSTIMYVLNCTSAAVSLKSNICNFPAKKKVKPSSVLIELMNNSEYRMFDLFKGMRGIGLSSFIATDDSPVDLQHKYCSVIDYISYLVSCMKYSKDAEKNIKTNCYFWSVYDDVGNKYGGTYFKVVRVSANTPLNNSYNTYEVDVGFPTSANVLDFSINNDDSWSLLYNYADSVAVPNQIVDVNDSGKLIFNDAPQILLSANSFSVTEEKRNWWSKMTQFPITAKLTIKGLLRPAMLMSYVKINTYFYGHKHTSSGLYMITRQEDSVTSQGYRTSLSLTRIGGDEHYA